MIEYRKPWRRQPQGGGLRLDPDSPFRAGLGFVCSGGEFRTNLATGGRASVTSTRVAASVTERGRAVYISDAASTGSNLLWPAAQAAFMGGATESTALIIFRGRNTSQAYHLFGSWNTATENHWLVQINGTGLVWIPAEDSGSNRRRWDATGVFTQNVVHTLLLIWRGGATAEMWLDGVNRTSALSAVNTAATSVRTAPATLHVGSQAGLAINTDVVLAAAWNKSVTDAADLALNPWQLFQPRRIFVPQVGITGLPTLSAATYVPGSLTASGFRPRVTAQY